MDTIANQIRYQLLQSYAALEGFISNKCLFMFWKLVTRDSLSRLTRLTCAMFVNDD